MSVLSPGHLFPTFSMPMAGGETLTIPDALAGGFGVVLFYRGAWCPYCNAQLRAFQRAADELSEVGAKVVAMSVDDEATTAATIAKHGLTFPVGHSADAAALHAATGAFVNPDPVFLQSTGFVLDPRGAVLISVYSSGAIGRLVPEDVIGMIRYVRSHTTSASSWKLASDHERHHCRHHQSREPCGRHRLLLRTGVPVRFGFTAQRLFRAAS